MKLTDEMKAAICNAYMQSKSVSEREEAIILAGYRMGQRDMRERAAKECYDTGDMTREDMEARRTAERIRKLSVEDANG